MLPPKLLNFRQALQDKQTNGALTDHENGILNELDNIHQINLGLKTNNKFNKSRPDHMESVAPASGACPCCHRPF